MKKNIINWTPSHEASEQTTGAVDCFGANDILTEIADELSINYMTVSFGEKIKNSETVAGIDKPDEIAEKIYSEDFKARNKSNDRGLKPCRNILVIGAGASFDAYKTMPLGKIAKWLLEVKLQFGNTLYENQLFNSKVKEEIKRILTFKKSVTETLPDNIFELIDLLDFENHLLLLSKFFREQDIRDTIQQMFDFRYAPSLFNEIVSHLFKHGFIDVIVNFNFDEQLDQALQEEMGQGDYYKIYSDGDCKSISDIIVDGRLKIPIYIKPHGTASHKSTLRFTKDHYFDLPDDIKLLLEKIFKGQLKDDEKDKSKIKRVNVFSVGFNLESIEFNEILAALPSHSKIFTFTFDSIPDICQKKLKSKSQKDGFKHRTLMMKLYQDNFESNAKYSPLSLIFMDLYNRIINNFSNQYQPRSIARHLILCELLQQNEYAKKGEKEARNILRNDIKDSDRKDHLLIYSNLQKEVQEEYKSLDFFRDKTLLEFAITISINRGKIDLKDSMSDRLGIVYRQYRNCFKKPNSESSLYHFCSVLQLKENLSFSRNLHNLTPISEDEKKSYSFQSLWRQLGWETHELDIENNIGNVIVSRLICSEESKDSLKNRFLIPESGDFNVELIKSIANYLNLLSGGYNNICPRFSDNRLFVFNHYFPDQILHTDLSLFYRFAEVFENPEYWDYLFLSTDTGLFIDKLATESKINFTDKNKIYLITCRDAVTSDYSVYSNANTINKEHLKKFKNQKLKNILTLKTLPYNDHNHHMAIFLKKESNLGTGPTEITKHPHLSINHPEGVGKENYLCIRSIYFYKRGFCNIINPLWVRGGFALIKDNIQNPEHYYPYLLSLDHEMLLETFYAYHRKALSFEDTSKLGQFLEILPPKDLNYSNKSKEEQSIRFNLEDLFLFIHNK